MAQITPPSSTADLLVPHTVKCKTAPELSQMYLVSQISWEKKKKKQQKCPPKKQPPKPTTLPFLKKLPNGFVLP